LLNAVFVSIANHMHLVTLTALEILPPPLPRALSKSGLSGAHLTSIIAHFQPNLGFAII
jgi:hypothetical protein